MTTTFDDVDDDLSWDDDDASIAPTNDVAATREYCPINVSSDDFWYQDSPGREKVLAQLRAHEPISWQPPIETALVPDPDDPGFWAVVKHKDIIEVSQRNDVFVSNYGVLFDLLPKMFLEMGQSILMMDNPQHDKIRKIVASAFTPKQLSFLEDKIQGAAKRIIGEAAAIEGEYDFVKVVAKHLPIEMFGDMFGIPHDLRPAFEEAADEIVAWTDPEVLRGRDGVEVQVAAALRIHEMVEVLYEDRDANPTDDLLSALVHAEVDGERLTPFDVGAFMVLVSVAATDTTRHTTSFGVKALTDYPDQRAWLFEDFDGRIKTAIEELLRWGTVVLTFRRTCVSEYQLGDKTILPGDKVVMMYSSANWDEDLFTNPSQFDLSRWPNPHLAFGGGGVHFCLGNQLAKSMLRALFKEISLQMPDFVAGEPHLTKTNFMRGVLSLPFTNKGFSS